MTLPAGSLPHRKSRSRSINRPAIVPAAIVSLLACGLLAHPVRAIDSVDFQVAWITVGEAAASADAQSAHAGRQLFSTSELAAMALHGARVARIDVEPAVLEVAAGEQVCISALHIRAFGADGRPISRAPLSITVRQDHREKLQLARSTRDICMRPSRRGEYPIRFTSMLPAPDGTSRGAQVFLRASDPGTAVD